MNTLYRLIQNIYFNNFIIQILKMKKNIRNINCLIKKSPKLLLSFEIFLQLLIGNFRN